MLPWLRAKVSRDVLVAGSSALYGLAALALAYLQNLAIPLYVGLAIVRPTFWIIFPVVLVEQFVAGIGQTAFSVFQMQRCRTDFSAAHFAFVTAIVGSVSAVSGIFAGPLSQRVSWPVFFAVCFVATLPSLQLKDVGGEDNLVRDNERMLTGGFYAEIDLTYDAVIAQEKNGRRYSVAGLRPIQLSKRGVLDALYEGRKKFTTAE